MDFSHLEADKVSNWVETCLILSASPNDQINADETSEIQGKVEINLTDENLKQSSSEV